MLDGGIDHLGEDDDGCEDRDDHEIRGAYAKDKAADEDGGCRIEMVSEVSFRFRGVEHPVDGVVEFLNPSSQGHESNAFPCATSSGTRKGSSHGHSRPDGGGRG